MKATAHMAFCALFVTACAAVAAEKPATGGIAPDGVPYAEADAAGDMKPVALTGNLLRNGSFEEGRHWPSGWDPCDKLGTMWAEGGTQGRRCIRIDTNILESQWLPWNETVLKLGADAAARGKGDAQSLKDDPIPAPPERLPTKPPYYNTVGGIHGIHYRSEFLRLKPGAIYRFTIDARLAERGEPKVFLKGFFDQRTMTEDGERIFKRNAYRSDMWLHNCNTTWQRYVRVFSPSRSTSTNKEQPLAAEWFRVEIFAYWPPGVYEFDNARLEIIGYESPRAPSKPPSESKKRAATPLADDEFPVIGK